MYRIKNKLRSRIRLAQMAGRRRKVDAPRFEDKDVWIVSPGGVATTCLIEHVSTFATTNDLHDEDELKHWPVPPVERLRRADTRVLYLKGEPRDVAASIARRGWITYQGAKLASPATALSIEPVKSALFRKAVSKQITRWEAVESANVMVLDYGEIWQRREDIADHLRISQPEFVEQFPKRRARTQ